MYKAIPLLLLCMACGAGTPAPERSPEEATSSGRARVDTVSADRRNGPQEIILPDGTRLNGQLKDGLRTGIWRATGPDGRLRSQTDYHQGKENGPTVVYHPNGALFYTGDNRNGHRVGVWRFRDDRGELVREVHYDDAGDEIARTDAP